MKWRGGEQRQVKWGQDSEEVLGGMGNLLKMKTPPNDGGGLFYSHDKALGPCITQRKIIFFLC